MQRLVMQFSVVILSLFTLYIGSFFTRIFVEEFTVGKMVSNLVSGNFDFVVSYIVVSFIVFLIFFAAIYFTLYKLDKIDWLLKGKDNKGSAVFAKEKDFRGITGKDGLPIGKKFRLSSQSSFTHYLLVGPTGSGKSASFFIPALIDLPSDASVIVTDPKGELFQKTAQNALDQGKRVLVFSPFRDNSMGYNPLALCRTSTEVRELAQILLANGSAAVEAITGTKAGGSEWTNMATPLLTAFLLFVKDMGPGDNTIANALDLIISNDLETMKMLIDDTGEETEQQFNIFMQSAGSEKTMSSIKTVLGTGLQMFTDPMVKRVTEFNEIDPTTLRDQPTHLYVIVPEHKSDYMAPLMSPFYTQLLSHLVETGKGSPIYFLLDEFANIGTIPGISKSLATVRSRNISISVGIQSINQLKSKYGKESQSILDNLKTKAFLPGLSHDSAEFASKLIGATEIESMSTSISQNKERSYSLSTQKRELLTPDEVRRLPDEKILIVTDNRNPIIDDQNRFYKNKRLLAITENELDLDDFIENSRP